MTPRHEARITSLLRGRRNYPERISEIAGRRKYVVFYGCGKILSSIVSAWSEFVGRRIDFCCDSDPEKWGQIFFGARCLSPAELEAIKEDCAVFVTIGDFRPVYESLMARGFPEVHLLFKYDLEASGFLDQLDEGATAAHLATVHGLLGDEVSRNTFDAILQRVCGDGSHVGVMADVCRGDQYFPRDVIDLSADECFVDVGAYDGDTVRAFLRRTNARFSRIFPLELSSRNFLALEETLRHAPGREKIRAFNVGAWDTECDVAHTFDHSQSAVGAGEGRARVAPLDSLLAGERVTFLKMDIEGAEPRALKGAAGIIAAQKPKLAICVYHDIRHLWEIPLYLKSCVPGYKIYLRHHTNLEYETVCYAVP